MWTRADLKARGKADFTRNYWSCILISLIIAILSGGAQSASGSISFQLSSISSIPSIFAGNYENEYSDYNDYNDYSDHNDYSDYSDNSDIDEFNDEFEQFLASSVFISMMIVVLVIICLFAIIGIVFSVFVASPLIVGGRRFFLENQYGNSKIARVGFIFKKGNYGNTVLTIFLEKLFIALWSLLFVIPGIIKSYSYWMIDYMMAENPSLSHKRAFEISQQTMKGQKWNVFVLDLSFILWNLLSVLTCGLLNIFYLNSYKDATKAQLYGFLRMNALSQGYASVEELPGYAPQIQPAQP